MRIRRVTVEKLFGIFDHEIELNEAERITILSGPNGFGKTILLRMIDGFLRGHYDIFARVPFAAFQVTFEDGQFLRLEPSEGPPQKGTPQEEAVQLRITSSRGESPFEFSRLSGQPTSSEEHSYSPYAIVLSSTEKAKKPSDPAPAWLHQWLEAVNVKLIETQRLDITDEDRGFRLRKQRRPTVLRHAADLAKRIQHLLGRYASRSQELDRAFPTRLLQPTKPPLAASALRDKLAALEEKRARLTALGFLPSEQRIDMLSPEAVEQKRDVLSIYAADMEEKLAVFDEMAAKIELLTRIVNDLFLYKRMSVNPEEGFVFTSKLTGHRIAPDNLSSGEQHQLVLLYELLFLSPQGALVLLDEPELSLHAAWQERFLDEMVALSGFDVLVATHSAEIIGEHWDLVVELKGPELHESLELADRSGASEQGS
jgi:energy-coupling factor transporter ATP-binding protein EcfA2